MNTEKEIPPERAASKRSFTGFIVKHWLKFAIACACVVVVAVLLWPKPGVRATEQSIAASPALLLPGSLPKSSSTATELSIVGTIEAGEVISVSAPFDAVVTEKEFSFDTMVNRAQPMLALDTNELQGRINEAKVAMLKSEKAKQELDSWEKGSEMARATRNTILARQQVEQSERKMQETEILLKKGIVPRSEYEGLVEQLNGQQAQLAAANDDLKAIHDKASRNNREIARIEFEQAQAKYRELVTALAQQKIAAPRAGIVAKVIPASGQSPATLDVGSRVIKGQPLFTIASVDKLRVAGKVDEVDVADLIPGMRAAISIDAQEMPPIAGRLVEISAQGSQSSGTSRSASFDIRIDIPELSEQQRRRVRVGMSCNVTIFKGGAAGDSPLVPPAR